MQRPFGKAGAHVSCNAGAPSPGADPNWLSPGLQRSSALQRGLKKPICLHNYRALTSERWIVGVSYLKVDIHLSQQLIETPLTFPLPSNHPTITKLLHASDGGEILFGNNIQPQISEEFGDDIFICPLWNSDSFSWDSFVRLEKCICGGLSNEISKMCSKNNLNVYDSMGVHVGNVYLWMHVHLLFMYGAWGGGRDFVSYFYVL